MLILTRKDIENLIEMKDVIDVVEKAFLELAEQTAICPTRLVINIKKYGGQAVIMPAYLGKMDALATKIVTNYAANPQEHDLPTILASIILNNSRTGEPLALMEGSYITALRTGAVGGLAIKYLARKDSKIVGVIGTGFQAMTQVRAACAMLKEIERVKAYDISRDRGERFAVEAAQKLNIKVEIVKSTKECVEGSDIVITATTSTVPVLDGDWVGLGTHINSFGWMGPNGRELDDKIVKKAKIYVDTKEGVLTESGDLIIPIRKGIIPKDKIYAELCEVVSGKKPGRRQNDELTCFKSVGVSVGDAATAKLVYERSLKVGVGIEVKL